MRHKRTWSDAPGDFFQPLSSPEAPAIAQRHICSGGAGGIIQAIADVVGAAGAPFTGGASLALPFAVTGIEDVASGNFSNLPMQLGGDVLSAVPFAAGEAGLLGGAADALGGAAGDAGGAAGGIGGALSDTGGVVSDLAPSFVAGAEAGAGADIGGTLAGGVVPTGGGIGDVLQAIGGGVGEGGPVGSLPEVSPVTSFGGATADAGPIGAGGGGSAMTAADPFGQGGVGTADLGTPGGPFTASGELTAEPVTFGQSAPSSAPALTGPGGSPFNPATGIGVPAQAVNPADLAAGAAGAGAPAGAPAGTGPAGSPWNPATGTGVPAPDPNSGLFSGIRDFLKQNKDLISLGTGAAGIGNAIWKNAEMQGGVDALMQQARQAQMFMQQFQGSYNSLISAALPLIQQGASGQVNPGQAAQLLATANRMKTEIKAKYASLGSGGGTNEQQDLNNVDIIIQGLQASLANATLNQGISLAGAAQGQGGLNAGAQGAIGQLARLNVASDADLANALAGLAKAAA